MEQVGGLEHLLKVLRAHTMPMGLRPYGAVDHGHHLLPMVLPVLVPLVAAMLGRSGVVITIPITKVASGFGLAADLGLDSLLTGGILGGDV